MYVEQHFDLFLSFIYYILCFFYFSYSYYWDDDLTLLWSSFLQSSLHSASRQTPPLLWRTHTVIGHFYKMEAFFTATTMDCYLSTWRVRSLPLINHLISLKELSSIHQLYQGIPIKKRKWNIKTQEWRSVVKFYISSNGHSMRILVIF